MTTQPDTEDLRGLARGLRQLVEIAARTLAEDAGPNELVARVTGHLGCGLSEVVAVRERFPIWDHVNVQRGVEAYLARHGSAGTWFGMATGMMRPHQDLLSRLATPAPGPMGKAGSASYGTAATGPDTDTEVVTLGPDRHDRARRRAGCDRYARRARVRRGVRELEILGGRPGRGVGEPGRDRAAIGRAQRLPRAGAQLRRERVSRQRACVVSAADSAGAPGRWCFPRCSGVHRTPRRRVGALAEDLRASGQHLKRGLLLYGPPGAARPIRSAT